MPKPPDPDLFAAAGLMLEEHARKTARISRPKRPRKPKPPTPAERAAAVRLEGGRRSRAPASLGQRSRVGTPRDLSPAPVLSFPLVRNATVLAEVIKRLPHCDPDELDVVCDREARKFEKRLISRGLQKQSARRCAKDLLHEAYMERVRELFERT
ncbi:hypothetical protein MCBMB27_02099 [Methylobacterium phyllosphaerae]|uniref:Uncharacterized protein n=1 Tax=Methylobacterium phyllosphaerae TaxID=418223 RepID=A0AAE8L5Q8_9HYPH|nr:hypothetical protein MCBMB27_02099 [Methylobacterium phyllosphaerae]SFG64463.1 hypothetical protein SAMN05192567_10648 [Methylobacterium phyllosphaerae]